MAVKRYDPEFKREIVRLRLKEGLPWIKIIERYQDQFPDLTLPQIRKRLSDIVQKSGENKALKIDEGEDCATFVKSGKLGDPKSDKLIAICESENITPAAILDLHDLNPDEWEVVVYRNNYWHGQEKGGKRVVMYQSRLTVRPKLKGITLEDIKKLFEETDFTFVKPPIEPLYFDPDGDTLEISLADLHSGLYAWFEEAGESYDVKIAKEHLMAAISDIVYRCQGRKYKKVIFAILGDLLHTDNDQQTTTRGTFQQVDGRMPKVFTTTFHMLRETIDLLLTIAPVEVIYTRGNHDYLTGWTPIKCLETAYEKDPNVSIDVSPNTQKSRLIGITLVGFVHGDMPEKNLSGWLQVQARKMPVRIVFMEVHSGHKHTLNTKERVQTGEQEGVVVRTMPALCNSSIWEHNEGYSGAIRSLVCYIWNDAHGLREMWYSNI